MYLLLLLAHTLNYPKWKLKSIVIVFMSFPSVCEVCAKVCSSERELKIHMDDHEGKVGCVCHHCGANFKERKAYERHIARNHKPRDIGCLHCDHKFENKDQAARHLAMHSGFKPYQCPSLAFNAFLSIVLIVHTYTWVLICFEALNHFEVRTLKMRYWSHLPFFQRALTSLTRSIMFTCT